MPWSSCYCSYCCYDVCIHRLRPSRAADTWGDAQILKNCCKYLLISYWGLSSGFSFCSAFLLIFFGMSVFEVQRQQLIVTSEISQLRSKTCSLNKTQQSRSWYIAHFIFCPSMILSVVAVSCGNEKLGTLHCMPAPCPLLPTWDWELEEFLCSSMFRLLYWMKVFWKRLVHNCGMRRSGSEQFTGE